MPANCPPPEPFFDVVTPGQAKDEVLAFDAQATTFDRDLARELNAHLLGKGYDEFGNLTYLPGWAELNLSWSQWWFAWQQFKKAHDEWSENLDGASVVRQVELRKCELIDYRQKLRELGGKPTGPEPRFTQASDTVSSLTGLVLAGLGAYVVVNLIRRK